RPAHRREIFQDDFKKVINGALLDDEAAVHIGLADGERRIECEPDLGPFVGDARRNGRAAMVAEAMVATFGVDQVEMTYRDKLIENVAERAEHRSTEAEPGPSNPWAQ